MNLVQTREPAVAGQFYPANPVILRQEIARYLAMAQHATTGLFSSPKALIVPHAGYIYSGPIAASAYATLISAREVINRVILMGPAHRVPFYGIAASSANIFLTPLGKIPIDQATISQIIKLPQVKIFDEAHRLEHSLEVQLPFLQSIFEQFTLVPLVVGQTNPSEVVAILDLLWGGAETLIIISSDLSHYQDTATARRLDAATSEAIETLNFNGIGDTQACGRHPIKGLLALAHQKGLKARTLDLRNSSDTAGSTDQVVGYGAYAFY